MFSTRWPAERMTDRVALARISSESISVDECARAVERDEAGAVVTFAGVVRNHDRGRDVVSLAYEAHPSAAEVIAAVAAEIAGQFESVRVAVEHRSGLLAVGEVALACAVSSAHRGEAFEACARLVDAVKARVPIWKLQRFADGTEEWVAAHDH